MTKSHTGNFAGERKRKRKGRKKKTQEKGRRRDYLINTFLSINKGFVMSPDSHFYTSSFGVGLKYYIDRNGIISEEKSFSKGKFKGIEVITKQDLYFNAKRDGNPTENLHQISLQINGENWQPHVTRAEYLLEKSQDTF